MYQTLVKADYNRMVIKFRNAHAVAKHRKSFCDYQFLCKLDKAKGLDIGDTYMNDKATATFVRAIANVAREEVCKTLKSANNLLFSIREIDN